jgi:hypothetical protein
MLREYRHKTDGLIIYLDNNRIDRSRGSLQTRELSRELELSVLDKQRFEVGCSLLFVGFASLPVVNLQCSLTQNSSKITSLKVLPYWAIKSPAE